MQNGLIRFVLKITKHAKLAVLQHKNCTHLKKVGIKQKTWKKRHNPSHKK
jgi:hypothetical protein